MKTSDINKLVEYAHQELQAKGSCSPAISQMLLGALQYVLGSAPFCRQCLKRTEIERWCYAIPMCYACLPPPEPIPTIEDE